MAPTRENWPKANAVPKDHSEMLQHKKNWEVFIKYNERLCHGGKHLHVLVLLDAEIVAVVSRTGVGKRKWPMSSPGIITRWWTGSSVQLVLQVVLHLVET